MTPMHRRTAETFRLERHRWQRCLCLDGLSTGAHMHAIRPVTTPATDSTDVHALARRSGITAARCDALSRELPAALDSLYRCRAWEVPEGHLDDYVALGWLTWSSGALALTAAGRAMRDLVMAREELP